MPVTGVTSRTRDGELFGTGSSVGESAHGEVASGRVGALEVRWGHGGAGRPGEGRAGAAWGRRGGSAPYTPRAHAERWIAEGRE